MQFMNDEGPMDPQVAYLNGYSIAERLLEDLLFKIEIIDDEIRCTGFHPDSERRVKNLLPQQAIDAYIKEMEVFAKKHDIFIDTNGEDCWIDPPQWESTALTPIPIKDSGDIFEMLGIKPKN